MEKIEIIVIISIVINAIVGVIFYTQIRKQKDIINAMKSFIEIFEVDEVKKYVKLKMESHELEVKDKLNKMIPKLVEELSEINYSHIIDNLGEFGPRYHEAINYIYEVYLKLSDKEKEKLLNILPNNKEIILDVYENEYDFKNYNS